MVPDFKRLSPMVEIHFAHKNYNENRNDHYTVSRLSATKIPKKETLILRAE